jgi:hypothetical protein
MEIGEPKEVREIEPVTVPVPEPIAVPEPAPRPFEPAPGDPVKASDPDALPAALRPPVPSTTRVLAPAGSSRPRWAELFVRTTGEQLTPFILEGRVVESASRVRCSTNASAG